MREMQGVFNCLSTYIYFLTFNSCQIMFEWVVDASLQQFYAYGVVIVTLLCLLEGMLVGKLLPGEILVAATAVLYSESLPILAGLMVLAVLASTCGQYALFALTQRGGPEWLLETRWLHITESHLETGERYFHRWGVPAVIGTSVFPIIRGTLTVPAALSDLPQRTFLMAAATGNTLYHAGVITLAAGFGIHIM